MKTRLRILWVAFFGMAALVSTISPAQQPKGGPKPKPSVPGARPAPAAKRPAQKPDAGAPAIEADREAGAPLAARPEATTGQPPADAGIGEMKTTDGGARVFRFGEMEIEGRLKSPQLVYFLRRVRAEFAAGDLGHRSFSRELSDTRGDPSF
jgi:hypothetical protein